MNQRKSFGTTHHRVGRRPNHPPPPSEGQRPDACRLSALARDYVNRIDECEEKRRRAEAEMDRRNHRRNAEAREREQDEWQRRETVFHQRIRAAHLDDIWIRYARQHPNADHSHKLPFLGWAHTTGAYAHGLKALEEDWRNAEAGRPVTRRRAPGPRQPQENQQQSRRTHTRPGGPGRASPLRGNQQGSGKAGASAGSRATTTASSSSSAGHAGRATAAASEDGRVPLSIRNWVVIGTLSSAALIAVAAMLLGG